MSMPDLIVCQTEKKKPPSSLVLTLMVLRNYGLYVLG